MAARFPTNIVTRAENEFKNTSNLGKSTLNGAISGTPATFAVVNATAVTTWPTSAFVVNIRKSDGTQSENVYISSRSGNTLTVGTRGFGGTSSQDHDNGSDVRVILDSATIQQMMDEIIAMQGHAGVAASLVHASVTTTPYTATSSDFFIPVNATGGARTVNLPTAVGIKGRVYTIVKTDSSGNAVTVDGSGSETINGATTKVLSSQYESVLIISDGANWLTYGGGGSSAGAPSDAQYLTLTANGTLTVERVFTPGTGMAATDGGAGNAYTLNVVGGGLVWTEVTGTSQAMVVNAAYIANNGSLVTLTLPDTAALGSIIRVVGKGTGGWRIAQNAGESIRWNESTVTTTGTGGRLDSTDDHDAIELLCTTANTTWTVLSSKGNITVT